MPDEQTDYSTNQRSSIRNVRRSSYESRSNPARRSVKQVPRARQTSNKQRETSLNQTEKEEKNQDGMFDTLRKWRIFLFSISLTSIVYSLQIFFATLTLIGIFALAGTEADWLVQAVDFLSFGSVANFGIALFWLGAGGAFLCGLIAYSIALSFFTASNIDGLQGINPLILAVCLTGLLCPILNFFPLIWLWCLYMVLASE